MLVRDPKNAVQALFEDNNKIITDSSFLKEYKRIKKISKVGETKAETHLGTLRIFGLVESIPNMTKGNNRLTSRGKMLKKLWVKKNQKDFEEGLSKTILTNPYKQSLFDTFLEFVSRAKTIEEVDEKFAWRTCASLIAWCELAGLIEQKSSGKYVVIKRTKITSKPDLEEIWLEVKKSYDEIRRLGYDKKKLIIRYGDLRFRCASNFHIEDPHEFDSWFCDLMHSKWSQFINLHGTLVGDYDAEENLRYRNRLYPFMSVTS